jgi:Nucleotidyltransferase of unknown function (DUF6036)
MPAKKEAPQLPSPWKEFLAEFDGILRDLSNCTASAALFSLTSTGCPARRPDIDYYTAIPANLNLDDVAGQGSPLHGKYGVWLHRVAVANLPEDYVSRLTDMAPGEFKFLKLLVPDPYDCILSKLERNAAKDRDDADFLFRSQELDAEVLRDRYKAELRHNLIGNVDWHDRTLELWIEIFGSKTE